MLLVSSITPSGAVWARESALASIPNLRMIDAIPRRHDALLENVCTRLSPAGVLAPNLVAGLASIQTATALASAVDESLRGGTAVWCPGSVATAASDLLTMADLLDLADPGADAAGVRELGNAASALRTGDVEWIVACPPEESAIDALLAEVAVGLACGLAVRGVLLAPMPSKSDGWPKQIRAAARRRFDEVCERLHPLPVARTRRGASPGFTESGVEVCAKVCAVSVNSHADGTLIWSITIPGLSACGVSIGAWSDDPAYSTTHVVLEIGGRTIYRAVDSTVRRCTATEAVVSGDSVAVTFLPAPQQWPTIQDGGADNG